MTQTKQPTLTTKLKIALLVDSDMASFYTHDLAQWAQQQSDLEVTHLIVQKLPTPLQNRFVRMKQTLEKHGLRYILEQIGFALICKIESMKLARFAEYRDHFSRKCLSTLVPHKLVVVPQISASGFVYRYGQKDVDAIKKLNLDVIIRCGSGILRGDILRAARFGILSFHHADNRINRGIPAGFWEVFHRQDSTGFTIQQLTEELDGGNVLYRGQFATKYFYLLNQAALFKQSNHYLKQMLTEIAATRALPVTLAEFPYFSPLFTRPTLWVQWRYGLRLVCTLVANLLNRFLWKKVERWSVAFCHSDWRQLVMWRSVVIPNPPQHFLADPFVVQEGDAHYCFVEDYDYRTARGCIAVYALHAKNAVRIGEALIEPFHLSFPYIFEYNSKRYMCPETSQNRDIRIYECVQFPLQWKLHTVIMPEVSAADSMLFEKDGLWWLFTNLDRFGTGDKCSELSIFYADSPLSQQWTPHPKNPMMVDAIRARNGGMVCDADGSIYRVSQCQGFEIYGKSTSINRIVCLTETDYLEETVHRIEPNFFKNIKGTHHLHSNGSFTVFDFLRKMRPMD